MAALFSDRGLSAAHILGAAIVASIGQLVVENPGGFFGSTDELTAWGAGFSTGSLALALVCLLLLLRGSRWARRVFTLLVAGNIGAFVPVLATDPIMAGGLIAWQLAILGREFFALRPAGLDVLTARRLNAEEPRLARWLPTLQHSLLVSLAVTTVVVGFQATELFVAQIACLVVDVVVLGLTLAIAWPILSRNRIGVASMVFVILLVLLSIGDLRSIIALLGGYQLLLLLWLTTLGPLLGELLEHFLERPALLLLTTFGFLTVLGAIILSFPASAAEATRIHPVDALFTATSAVCVTGLIVLDTPTAFSTFGHAFILFLIQVGGLGIMVLSTFAAVVVGGRLGLRSEAALEEVLDLSSPARAYQLTRFIVLSTCGIEGVGALILTWRFAAHGVALPDALWYGVFHAISAFCNAGFALQSDSVVMFQEDPIALLTLGTLITMGGLGFVVLGWGWQRLVRRSGERASIQVKVVLAVSAALVLLGTAAFLVFEWNAMLRGYSPAYKLLNAWFQSVSLRTAGFNSIDFAHIRPVTVLAAMALMFVGGSPGGTGGGVKTTTLAILIATIPAIARGEPQPVLFRREVGSQSVMRAATIALIAALAFFIVLTLLLSGHDVPFLELAFESLSALSTVGMSLGATAQLDQLGKIVIVCAMFVGRLGPLSLAVLLSTPKRRALAYPEAKIMVG